MTSFIEVLYAVMIVGGYVNLFSSMKGFKMWYELFSVRERML